MLSLAGANPRDYAILQVFLQTGIRVSELANLKIEDIDFIQRSGRRLKPWWVSSAKIRHSGKVQCFSAKEGSYASPLA